MMENADLTRELNVAGTPNQINKMTEDPDDTISPEAGVAAVPNGPSVVVKSASQSVPDMVVDCLPDWTVLDLKQFLCDEHPLKPTVKEQRLIYSGHLMTDDSLLISLLKHSSSAEGRFVLHLVCAPSRVLKSGVPPPYVAHPSTTAGAASSSSGGSSSSGSSPLASSGASELRQRAGSAQPATEGWTQAVQGGAELPADVRAQAEAYKLYYENYMRSYFAYLQSVGVVVNPSDPSLMAAWRQQLLGLPEQIPAAAAASDGSDQLPLPRDAQPAPQPQLNVDELQIVDEDANQHDWLDSLYIFVRFGILIFFVYFYSSFYRFFIIITVGVLIYLYRVGWFRTIAQPAEDARPRDAQQQQPQVQQLPARRTPPVPTQPAPRNSVERTNTADGGPSSAATSADRTSTSAAIPRDLADAAASLPSSSVPSTSSGASPAHASASKTEDAASCPADSTTREREPSSEEAESVSAVREAQGELNTDPPLERPPAAAADVVTDSAAQGGTTPPPPAASFLTLSWTFITALLTSLVPDQQQIL